MTLIRRASPWDDLFTLRRTVERLFDEDARPRFWRATFTGAEPALDITTNKDELVVKASLAGWKPDDVEITLTGNTLTIAGDAKRSGFYYRTYPQGPVAPQIVGYDSARYGQSGIEASLNGYLSGADAGTQGLIDRLLGRHTPGANVRLTIVPAVQKVAQSALGSQIGAIVALDPTTGAVIGGLTIQVGDELIDASVVSRLVAVRRKLAG